MTSYSNTLASLAFLNTITTFKKAHEVNNVLLAQADKERQELERRDAEARKEQSRPSTR